MKDHYRIVAIADSHVGGERWGIDADKWTEPVWEAMAYASENDVDVIVVLGDLFHRRSPTPAEYRRAMEALMEPCRPLLIIDGNHDVGAARDSISATWAFNLPVRADICVVRGQAGYVVFEGPAWMRKGEGIQFVTLPWPRLADYGFLNDDDRHGLAEKLGSAREHVLSLLRIAAEKIDPRYPALLVGHAMLSYGANMAPNDPGLMLGKDIVLPVSELPIGEDGPVDIALFGHVHQPDAFYVGSTQPTDFADVIPKSFTVIDFERDGDDGRWEYERKDIRYKTSLKVWDCVIVHEDETRTVEGRMLDAYRIECERRGLTEGPRFDVARARVVGNGVDIDPAKVRKVLGELADRVVSVDIVRPQQQVRRLGGDDAPIVATMKPDEALAKWLEVTGRTDEALRKRTLETFRELLHSTGTAGIPQ